jgi:hypothetical protein
MPRVLDPENGMGDKGKVVSGLQRRVTWRDVWRRRGGVSAIPELSPLGDPG